MKQVLQQARNGEVAVLEVPAPQLLPGCVLVQVAASLVSAGTERASAEFAAKNLFQKAQARPDLVREVIAKVQRDGLWSAVHAVRTRLDQPSSVGYSSAGTVIAVGEGIVDLAPGDRVACAGAGFAVHAETASVPRMLTANIPDEVGFEAAAFTTVGAVALHGIRTADVKLGDSVAVIGLGLLGQLTVQALKAAGCRVFATDPVSDRVQLAVQMGADAASHLTDGFRDLCFQSTAGQGVDAVLIAAETPSSHPVNLAAEVARDRAVVTAVGTVGMALERKLYYGKELDFRVSRSYGPGRYDAAFEQKGRDYPIGYVRWTETRNMEAFLRLVADRKLNLTPLITHRVPIERAEEAYEIITGRSGERFLGVLITYGEHPATAAKLQLVPGVRPQPDAGQKIRLGLLGTGSFALGTLLPAIKLAGDTDLVSACAASGVHARYAAEKFGFRTCTTDETEILTCPETNTVVIATRHHLHAKQVLAALRSNKHVFCEKPLCLREPELAEIVEAYRGHARPPLLMVGFNRRFAAMALRMKSFLRELGEPLALHYRINAGRLPHDHWTNDPEIGGGRILGEVCHFIDLLSFLTGSRPVEVHTRSLENPGHYSGDNVLIALQFADGSHGTVSYLANGDRAFSKERLEVLGGGRVAVLEDFRRLELISHGRRQVLRSRWRQDKGHRGEWKAFAEAVRNGGAAPIPFDEIVASTLATLSAESSRRTGRAVAVDVDAFLNDNGSLELRNLIH